MRGGKRRIIVKPGDTTTANCSPHQLVAEEKDFMPTDGKPHSHRQKSK